MRSLAVLDTGPRSLLQDLGRPGRASIGVSISGAFDRTALALANRLVGNSEGLTCIETVLGGLRLRAGATLTLAVTGAAGPIRVDRASRSSVADRQAPLVLERGDEIAIGMPAHGLRTYISVRGGIQAPAVLGSSSYDELSGLGPPPLSPGDVLLVGSEPATPMNVDYAPWREASRVLHAIPGPHHHGSGVHLLGEDAFEILESASYAVESSSNRIGVRLTGPALPRVPGELPSAPMRPGAIQVPGNGLPVILGPDAPTTGGFPVLATLTPSALDAIAQARPGDLVRFRILRSRTLLSPA